MAAQYSNRHFFRKTPNVYLAQFFSAKGVPLAADVSQLKENDAEALQTALNALDDSQIADIEAEFQDVNALACEGGITALVDQAVFMVMMPLLPRSQRLTASMPRRTGRF